MLRSRTCAPEGRQGKPECCASHLGRLCARLDLALLAVLGLVVKLDFVGIEPRCLLLLVVFLLVLFLFAAFRQRKIGLCLGPAGALLERLLIGADRLFRLVEMHQRIALVKIALGCRRLGKCVDCVLIAAGAIE